MTGKDLFKLTLDNIEKCFNQEINCIGDNQKYSWAASTPDVFCYEGHIGALCESCDIFEEYFNESWAPSGAY